MKNVMIRTTFTNGVTIDFNSFEQYKTVESLAQKFGRVKSVFVYGDEVKKIRFCDRIGETNAFVFEDLDGEKRVLA